ncbi:ATP-binding protein [Gordonia sp. (in: high G+C Gram-positive bacteria)]|uniref:ATP-binding protein n=1 Tax=Gordonia sp. (in: high G+C Gram-positive bacteria) TaxID=84139 RepID=UPI003F94D679
MNADEWHEICRYYDEGESIKGIALRLGMSRNTVRRALSLEAPPADHRQLKGSAVDVVDQQIRDLIADTPDMGIAAIGRIVGWERSRTLLARRVTEVRAEEVAARRAASAVAVLPQCPTSFVGRRVELRDLRGLLGDHRLVTVLGPGGIGKTRLAVQAASDYRRAFPGGVRFVDLTSVRNDELLGQTVCDALGLESRDAHDRSPEDTLIEYLRTRRMLLVLDNCEHVIGGAADLVARLLEETTGPRVMVTSREYLAITGEYVLNLNPLPIRDAGRDAVELFTNRAAAVLSGFTVDDSSIEVVRRICERLDGLPLAIELACARLTVLSVHELAERLDHRLSLLTVGSRDRTFRHRSLHATIDWSYELCNDAERLLWSRVAVFADGFDLDLAAQVCAIDGAVSEPELFDTVSGLVAKSVLVRETSGSHSRFRMLESIREYGWGRLSPSERAQMIAKTIEWCSRVIVDSAAHWFGPDQVTKAAVVQTNRANIRLALHHALTVSSNTDQVLIATNALAEAPFLWACGISIREHRMWLTRAVELPGIPEATKGQMFGVLALAQTLQGDRTAADESMRNARMIAESEHDRVTAAFATHTEGLRAMFSGEFATAKARFAEAARLYAQHDVGPTMISTLRVHQGMLLSALSDVAGARAIFSDVRAAAEAAGERWFHSYATYGLGLVALLDDDAATASALARQALGDHRPFGDTVGTTLMSDLVGWTLEAGGDSAGSAVVLGAASSMWGSIGQQLYGSDHWNALREEAVVRARGHLGDDVFDREWERGRAMSTAELYEFVFACHDVARTALAEVDAVAAPRLRSRSSPASAVALSSREKEVASLVAAGMTNKEIAEKLVLSPRTVEGHVEHVLRKLCLRRRAEVASALSG